MFQVSVQDGLARAGAVVTKHATIATPAPMLYTRRGAAVFLSPDMLERLRPAAGTGVQQQELLLQVNALQFLNQPTPEVLQQFGRGVADYMGLPGWPCFASNRDPALTEYINNKQANDGAVYATLHTGAAWVTPQRYMQAIHAMQPDMFVALADEVPADAKPKRLTASVDRTISWLDECIKLRQQHEQKQPAEAAAGASSTNGSSGNTNGSSGNTNGSSSCQLFAPVVGAASEAERSRSAKAAAERDVAGFALCGFGMGEPLSARPGLLAAALQHLPADKPRAAVGLDSPEDVLAAVSAGVDLLDCSYPLHATANGYALCFPVSQVQEQAQEQPEQQQLGVVDAGRGSDDSKLNLWGLAYRLDARPLVPGCSCFACAHHSRAYIHHLLHTHEMLAGVLLEAHNTHTWLAFFAALREAIRAGALAEYVAWWGARRERGQQQQQGVVGEQQRQPPAEKQQQGMEA